MGTEELPHRGHRAGGGIGTMAQCWRALLALDLFEAGFGDLRSISGGLARIGGGGGITGAPPSRPGPSESGALRAPLPAAEAA